MERAGQGIGSGAADLRWLSRRLALHPSADAIAGLADCVIERVTSERDRALIAEGGLADQLWVLGDGFAFDYTLLAGGKRHIFDFYGPGAICNWPRPEREDRPENLLVKARSDVFALDRVRLEALLAERQELARAIHEHETRRAMRISQRVRALISLPARECMRMLLLDMDDEYALTFNESGFVPMPLTQEEIGDLIGATSVHVSRTLTALEKDGEIERQGSAFRLSESAALRRRLAYRSFRDPIA